MHIKNITVGIVVLICLFSCNNIKQQSSNAAAPVDEDSYLSIKKLAISQYNLYYGMPFVFTHIIGRDGERDSTIVSVDSVDWGAVFKVFVATDIEDKKYHGQYTVSSFSDDMTQTRSLYYEAKDPHLFTQRLQVSVDEYGSRLRSVYIETHKGSFWHTRSQKLLYIPKKIIQIQEFNSYLIGSSKKTIEEYRFGVGEDD